MKKVIKINEKDIENLVKKIIKEDEYEDEDMGEDYVFEEWDLIEKMAKRNDEIGLLAKAIIDIASR